MVKISQIYRKVMKTYSAVSRRWLPFGYALPPLHYYFEVTRRCNLRCRMCLYIDWLENTPARKQKEGELTTNEWLGLVDQTQPASLISFTGGEPWVRRDFDTILRHACRKRRVHVISNGTRLTPDRAAELVKIAPRRTGGRGLNFLGISIHGMAQTHDQIAVQKNAFDRSLQSVDSIARSRRDLRKSCPAVHVTCVVQEENLADIPDLIRAASSAGADIINLVTELRQFDLPDFGQTAPWEYGADSLQRPRIPRDELGDAIAAAYATAKECGVDLRLPEMPRDDFLAYHEAGMPVDEYSCRTTWTALSIDAKGGAFPCFMYGVGDVRNETLAKLWNGRAMRNFRKELRKGLSPVCQGCCSLQYHGSAPVL